jgi:sugar-specific transcriptional regulator TrmB
MYGMSRTTDDPPDQGQTRELLKLLGDENNWAVMRYLLRKGQANQEAIVEATGIERTQISRVLARLRRARLVFTSSGRPAAHQAVLADHVLKLILAADQLAEAVNQRRRAGQETASRQTRRDTVTTVDVDERSGG